MQRLNFSEVYQSGIFKSNRFSRRFPPCPLPSLSTEDVYEEVVGSLRPETEHLVFYDDALLSRHEAVFQLCEKVLRFRTVHFHTPNGLSVDHVSEKVAEGLKMNNFGQIYLGFETHDDRIHAYLLMGHDLISPSSVEQSIIEAIRYRGPKMETAFFRIIHSIPSSRTRRAGRIDGLPRRRSTA